MTALNSNSVKTTKKARNMSANEIVLQNLDKGLLTITMNRPDRRNALNPDMTMGLVAAARRAAEDHEVRAVLLKGAGGTFCVGGDVKAMGGGGRGGRSKPRRRISGAAWKSRASCTRCKSPWWRRSMARPPGPGFRLRSP